MDHQGELQHTRKRKLHWALPCSQGLDAVGFDGWMGTPPSALACWLQIAAEWARDKNCIQTAADEWYWDDVKKAGYRLLGCFGGDNNNRRSVGVLVMCL